MADVPELARKLVEFYEKLSSWEYAVVRGSELTPGQMHAVEIIGHEEPLRMKELAEKLGVTTGTLTVAVDKLEGLGLLQRRPHAKDRRSYLVELTAAGRELFSRHHQSHIQLTEELAADLAPEEVATFSRVLAKMVERF